MKIGLNEIEFFLRKYELYVHVEKGLSKNSIEAYKNDLRIFYRYVKWRAQGWDTEEVSFVVDFISLLSQKGRSRTSLNRMLSSIKGFVIFCHSEVGGSSSPVLSIESLKVKKKMLKYLTEEEVQQLLSFPVIDVKSYKTTIAIKLLYSLGVRVSELCSIKVGDIDELGSVVKVCGKGRKQRYIPLYDELIVDLKNYVDYYRLSQDDFLMGVSRQKIWKSIAKRGFDCKIEQPLYPHLFRHCFASHMAERGAEIRQIQELLGHSDIQTTQIYTHLNKKYLKEVLDSKIML